MNNFTFWNPTRIVFGQNTISNLNTLIPEGHQIILCSGKGSIKENGVYQSIYKAIGQRIALECSGIPANPDFDQLVAFVEQIKQFSNPFLLAAGGGSVLDGVKFIAAAAYYAGDPWDILLQGAKISQAWPLGAILTLPATGSESNGNAVISRRSTQEKYGFYSPLVYPQFAILDPDTTFSLSKRQTANGIVDTFVHTTEQYLNKDTDAWVTDRLSETILSLLVQKGPEVLVRPIDYTLRSNIMWASTLALNGLLSCGNVGDWATHMIGHELTALYGLDHGQTLAVVLPGVLEARKQAKHAKLLMYAQRVWGLNQGDERVLVDEAIARTILFFESLGVGTRLRDYGIAPQEAADQIAQRAQARSWKLGEDADIDSQMVHSIILSRA
jgi:NADP-dependent alcohol dehydrogenase